ncbi:hypothetical protein WA026_001226 [Henosepilachna vigintioctopunctata]|uniref:Uncharacterized protein n=1 Tax=Henosepilachna vigintioctopunctata TaxID=420089 RepID=A0AAW1UJW7_9CUCU
MSSAYLRVQRWRALNKTEKVSNKNINNSVDNEQSFNNGSVNISCVSEVNDISVTDSCNLQAFNSHNLDNDNNYDFICTSDNDSDSSEYSSSKIKGSDCSENNNDEQLPGDAVHSFSPHNSEKVMQKTLSEKLRCWTLDNLNILTSNVVTELLTILREEGHEDLPKTSRQLLKTKHCRPMKSVLSKRETSGSYIYIGITNVLNKIILLFSNELHLIKQSINYL